MSQTTFKDFGPPAIAAAWLNDVDAFVYGPSGSTGPVLKTDLAASTGAGLVGFVQAGTGAVARTVQSKERDILNAKDKGALVDGVTDDAAAIQNAINEANVVTIGKGTGSCMIGSQIVISSPCHLIIETTISPKVNAVAAGTPMFLITSSNVTIEFRKNSGLDFISAAFSNWNGIAAQGTTGMLDAITVTGGKHVNVAIDKTVAMVISLTGVRGGYIARNKITNCGVVSNVVGGGICIYTAGCEDTVVENNKGDTCGSTFINSSCNLNCSFLNNRAKNTTLFSFKGGYGANTAISADAAPTTTSFTIPKTATTSQFFKVGMSFCFPRTTFPAPKGTIKTLVDNGTYYAITTAVVMPATPNAAETVQLMDTNSEWVNNTSIFSGDNAYNQNGVAGITVSGGTVEYAGGYTAVGTFAGLASGVWIGYDPQGSNNSMENDRVVVKGVKALNCKGPGIEIFSSNEVDVFDNIVRNFNTSGSTGWVGINVNRLGYHQQNTARISGNLVNGVTAGAKAISLTFTTNGQVTNNIVSAIDGVEVASCTNVQVLGNNITTTGSAAQAVLVSNPSANPSAGIVLENNYTSVGTANSNNIRISDVAVTNMTVGRNNQYYGSATDKVYSDNANGSGFAPFGGYRGTPDQKFVTFTVPSGGTVELGRFFADNGTAGGCFVQGQVWGGGKLEAFRTVFVGNVVANSVNFTTAGTAAAGVLLAAGDFIATVSGQYVICSYKNNTAGGVNGVVDVTSNGRF